MVHPATGLPRYAKPGAVGKVVFQLANLQKKDRTAAPPPAKYPDADTNGTKSGLAGTSSDLVLLTRQVFFSRPADIFRPSIRTALLPYTASNQRREVLIKKRHGRRIPTAAIKEREKNSAAFIVTITQNAAEILCIKGLQTGLSGTKATG